MDTLIMPTHVKTKCEFCNIKFDKLVSQVNQNKKLGRSNFCSRSCRSKSMINRISVQCSNCGDSLLIKPHIYDKSKSKRFYCDSSCAATYNNKHKSFGYKRSKLELYIQDQLLVDFPDVNFEFNTKVVINSELDVYCPELKLAIEINGIVHYEPLYGEDKFERLQNNDQQKMIECFKQGIELIVINASSHSYVTDKTCDKYYQEVKSIIESISHRC